MQIHTHKRFHVDMFHFCLCSKLSEQVNISGEMELHANMISYGN